MAWEGWIAAVQLPWSSLPLGLCTCCSHLLEGLIRSHITLLVPIHLFGVSRDISPGKPSLTSQNWIGVPPGHPMAISTPILPCPLIYSPVSHLYTVSSQRIRNTSASLPCPHHLTQCFINSGHLLNTVGGKNQCLYVLNVYSVPDIILSAIHTVLTTSL